GDHLLKIELKEAPVSVNEEELCDLCTRKQECTIRNRLTNRYGQFRMLRCESYTEIGQGSQAESLLVMATA
ncbi:MAG: hypothetical protein OEY31_09730, partial [Candidatus Bathyarchaeota archaeon]|nr:hypothetical protein [Candidatus Bathyarchaeota archaeon]